MTRDAGDENGLPMAALDEANVCALAALFRFRYVLFIRTMPALAARRSNAGQLFRLNNGAMPIHWPARYVCPVLNVGGPTRMASPLYIH